MSVGTMVILVIAVVLLVLSLMFVRRIFAGATYNVDQLNDAVRGEINKLFGQEGGKIGLYLPGNTATIKQRDTFGVAFGIKNLDASASFSYQVQATEVSPKCSNVGVDDANNWIVLGRTGRDITISSGDVAFGIVKIRVPEGATVGCQVRYSGNVDRGGVGYASFFFDVEVEGSGLGGI